MRINKYLAQSTFLSRRSADVAVQSRRVCINGVVAMTGDQVETGDVVTLDDRTITPPVKTTTIILNKPTGYVVSRKGQGSDTIYQLLPGEYQQLNPVGRLDKDSSGLLLMTNDGDLANELAHPSKQKNKVYEVTLDRPLTANDKSRIEKGVEIEDGPSSLQIANGKGNSTYLITMHEGRNRQIRRTFAAVKYTVVSLHRIKFGDYNLNNIQPGKFTEV